MYGGKYIYVLPKLINYIFTTSFDLWIFKGIHDIFAIVINFLGFDWYPKHVTIGLFEITETTCQTLANNLRELFDQYGLKKNIVLYVKTGVLNLNAMIIALKYETLGLNQSFQSTFWPCSLQNMLVCYK
jgi:hypothetical protein